METPIKSRLQKKKIKKELPLAFSKVNYILLIVGIVTILAGFYALGQMPVMGTMPLVVAPILLILAYCVILPVAIMYRKKEKQGVVNTVEPPRS